ncbi:hypothetical protein FLONG3_10562 [Fusarium longipes]|uniref:Uncharacterized protein n=1 Tax=Fusarium longipes TaxID=694270 RepID=A0A395RMH6_9HYPO|nr:hypothetical protein FLONG3_10562 [Fusarium longipes]
MQPIPRITITSPTGDQVPVLLFPLPAPRSAVVEPWEFFSDQLADPEPEPEPEQCGRELHLHHSRIAAEAIEQGQKLCDELYAHLPDILSEFKTMRVPADEFQREKCRICGYTFFKTKALRIHLGLGGRGLACKKAKELIAAHEEEEEEEEEDVAPPPKKRRLAKRG